MATSLSEIYDRFMMNVTDYRLTDLYNTSEESFETYLQAWLEDAVDDFDECSQSLVFDDETKLFTVDLTTKNKNILAKLMVKYWLQKLVNDVTQMNLHITDRDFRVASEAMNLREKREYYAMVVEECSQLLNNYEYDENDWDSWYNQSFEGD
jgi:hypothetical protein